MGEPLITAYFVCAGVLLMGACHALVMSRTSPYPHAARVFSALCLCFALFQFFCGLQYAQKTQEAALHMHKWLNLFSLAIIPLLSYCMAALSTTRGHVYFSAALAAMIAGYIVYNFASPYGYRFTSLRPDSAMQLPWGEQLYLLSGVPTPATIGLRTAQLVLLVQVTLFARKQGSLGKGFVRGVVIVSGVLMFVSLSMGGLADAGKINAPYLGGFGFLVMLGAYSLLQRRDMKDSGDERQRISEALDQEVAIHGKTRERLEQLLYHDPLTGLPNRAGMLALLEQQQAAAHHSNGKLAVLLVELDQFDLVNATQGHGASDQLLAQAAARLRENCRDGDLIARGAGGKFAVLAPGLATAEDARTLHKRLAVAFSEAFEIAGQALNVSATTGVAFFPEHGLSAAELLAAAELALHEAKAGERGQLRLFHPALNHRTQEKAQFAGALRAAYEQGQFLLHYQPQVASADGRTVCMEALMRWQHPVKGMVMPARFIPLAEEAGLIVPLGAWAIDTACRQLAQWRALGHEEVRIAVNLSSRQLLDDELGRTVTHALRRHKLKPGDLELEITESILLRDPDSAVARLNELRELGIRLSIDDFGTGYSSLNYIKVLPVHAFKLDRSFVQDIQAKSRDLAICETAVRLADHLGLEVVAEGVETQAQVQLLRNLGCHLFQGYYFAEPMSPAEATAYLVAGGRAEVETC